MTGAMGVVGLHLLRVFVQSPYVPVSCSIVLQSDPVTECFFEISSNLRNTSVCSLCIESSSSIASSADTTL